MKVRDLILELTGIELSPEEPIVVVQEIEFTESVREALSREVKIRMWNESGLADTFEDINDVKYDGEKDIVILEA